MKRFIPALLLLANLSTAQPVEETVYITNDGTIPIAVLPFKSEGGTIEKDKPWYIIASDFDFSSRVTLHKINKPDSALFADKNVQLYVDGTYKTSGDSVYLTISLNDIRTGEQLLGKQFPIKKTVLRDVSHRFSNLVLESVDKVKGPFETKILYCRRTKTGKDVYIMDYDGHRSKQLTRGGLNLMPNFIDDNRFVWVGYQRGKPDIYGGSLTEGRIIPLIYSRRIESSPDYSPIRGRIAYSSTISGNSEIYTADIQGKNRQKLTVSPGIDGAPAWSPNGYYIAFTSDRSGSPQIYVMDYTGANEKRLTFNGSYHDSPVWSPDGKKIAYTAQRNGKFDIFTINLDGTEETKVSGVLPGSNQYPVWSPDGSQIVFVNSRGALSNLYRVKADGTGEAVAITKTGDVDMPAWSFIKE